MGPLIFGELDGIISLLRGKGCLAINRDFACLK